MEEPTCREMLAAEKTLRSGPQVPGSDKDPWAHRSRGMRCRTCMFFVPKVVPGSLAVVDPGSVGRCRRHAPTMSGYPVVFASDWCGDHKLDEEKA